MACLNRFSVAPLWHQTRRLADVAAARSPADLVITGARVLSTYSERILDDREIWVSGGRVAAVKPAGAHRSWGAAPHAVYDARGGILAPGLLDAHLHIESSMVTACCYAEAALLNGTTTIFCDSHEIANVLDVAGIEAMLEDARQAPLSIYLTVPSTVPATSPEFETAGGDLTADKIGALFDRWPEAVALGEKMDFVPVTLGDERSHAIIAAALSRGRPVSGHIYGREFVAAYAASGITDTHEAVSREISEDFVDAGMWVILRGGSPDTPFNSIVEAIKPITELGVSHKRYCLCTDNRDPDDLMVFGVDWIVREAIRLGIKPEKAWSMGSLHSATRFGLDGEIGGLGSGRRADIVLLDDEQRPVNTWYGGQLMVEDRKVTPVLEEALSQRYRYSQAAYNTVQIPQLAKLVPQMPAGPCTANCIGIEPPGIMLPHRRIDVEPQSDWQTFLEKYNLTFVTVIERHGRSDGGVAHGFLHDFGLKQGAIASSVGHDSHNVTVAGTNEADMRLAVKSLIEAKGGVVLVQNSTVSAMVSLPIAGLLSDKRVNEVGAETQALKAAWAEAGCRIPYVSFSLIPLPVIPEIRISDKGLVKVPEMTMVPLYF